ncbi:MAG: CsgG/HfaB family protein [Thermodesulfobacteriota bacterium]|nr:CsgG/HfaB family protein [Thermodesulfobacteriota bacterium]
MRNKIKCTSGFFFMLCASIFFTVTSGSMNAGAVVSKTESSRTSIAVLSHTDFLPDATGVYDRRSWHGRDKNPAFALNNDLGTGSDQTYGNVERKYEYASEAVGLPEILADAILEQLTKSKRFIPVERKSLRTAVLEQRFGKKIAASYLDRTLDTAIQDMDKYEIGGGLAKPSATTGEKYNDLLHDFKDLAAAVGAKYLVLGNLHQLGSSTQKKQVPLSERGRTAVKKTTEARLRLRVIDSTTSTVVGADSLHLKVSSMLFEGGPERDDDFEFMEQVSKEAANKILDIIFPATVVSVEPLVISRGRNDSVRSGDEFTIVREGKEIKESSGAVIARLKEPIGRVKVIKVQETVSVVSAVDGTGFVSGDLAVRIALRKQSVAGSSPVLLKTAEGEQVKGLPRVAIGLVKAGSTAKTGPDAGKHVPTFTDSIITRLVQSKRFTVIDRQEVDQLLDEQTAQALAENRDIPSAMGTLKGCDYLVIGSLQNFSMEEQAIKLPNSSRVMEVLDGFAEGNMRLVDARSGDIMESRKISVRKQLDIQAGEDRLIAALADNFAAQIVASLLNAVYPTKVAAVAPDGTVYVNRGSDGNLSQGAVLDVFRPGQKVIDPDTGVELGSMDSKVGQVELTTVEENRSLGRIIEGNAGQAGDLLKLVKAGIVDNSTNKAQRSGGMLPGAAVSQGGGSVTQPKARGKATLALVKITLNARQQFDDNSKVSGIQQGTMDQLTDNVADALAKTNRFVMMERRQIDQVIDEKTFNAAAQGGDIRDYLTKLEGSDYLVIGELTNFYLHIRKKKVPYLDEVEVTYTGFIEGNQRIVDSHTSEMIATEKVRIKKKFKQHIGLSEQRTQLIDMYATEAAAGIVQRIYPIKILGVLPEGTIFINRGADVGMKVDSIFTVERPGQELIDPDTGISFGSAETMVGVLKIISVEAARSRAQMVDSGIPAAGDILRNKKIPTKPKPKPKIKVAW